MSFARIFDKIGANPIDNLLALRVAFMGTTDVALKLGYPEHVEKNREVVLQILDELRQAVVAHDVTAPLMPDPASRIIRPN